MNKKKKSTLDSFVNSLIQKCKGANYPAVSNKENKTYYSPSSPSAKIRFAGGACRKTA